ncbi:MAG TPA: MFS transporter [Nitrososphaerales archaeon]|nr:MFS transporter [Nitrososphaerales archaeon]
MANLSDSGVPPGPAAAVEAPKVRFEGLIIVGILLALLMGALDNFVALTALPTILLQFGTPNSGTFVISAYVITSTAGIPIFAKLSDIWSRRNVFLAALVVFMVGSVLSGLSQNLTELIVFRAIQGLGSGGFFPVGIAIAAVVFPPKTRARVVGALSGVFGIAVVAGPLIGSAIVQYTSWRWVFYVNIPVGLAGFALVAATLGPLRPELVRKFDTLGAVLLVGWVAAIMFPLYQIVDSGWGWTDLRTVGLLGLGAAIVVAFVLWELRAKNPLVPLRLFGLRVMSAGGGATFFIGLVFFPVATFLSLVVGIVLVPAGSNSAATVRDILYFLVLPIVIGAALGGQLLTRLSYRTVAVVGIAIGMVGMAGLSTLSTTTPLWKFALGFVPVGGVVLPLMPLGFGVGLTFPVFLLAAQNQVQMADVGEAGGLIQFLQSLGGAIGLSVLASFQSTQFAALDPRPSPACASANPPAAICGSYLGSLESSLIKSYDQTFVVMLGLLVVAFLFALFLKGRLPKGAPRDAPEQEAASVAAPPPLVQLVEPRFPNSL